jgi:hypothetical protein
MWQKNKVYVGIITFANILQVYFVEKIEDENKERLGGITHI